MLRRYEVFKILELDRTYETTIKFISIFEAEQQIDK